MIDQLSEKQIKEKLIFLCRAIHQEAYGNQPSEKIIRKAIHEIRHLKSIQQAKT